MLFICDYSTTFFAYIPLENRAFSLGLNNLQFATDFPGTAEVYLDQVT